MLMVACKYKVYGTLNYLIMQYGTTTYFFLRSVNLVLQSRFHIVSTLFFFVAGRGVDGDGGVRRAAQTAPARCGISSLDDTRGEIDRL